MKKKKTTIKTTTGLPPESPEEIIITDGQVRQKRHLSGYYNPLNEKYPEGWGDEEVRKMAQEKAFAAYHETESDKIQASDVDKCVAQYKAAYTNITPNDEQSIQHLCALEAQIARITLQLGGGGLSPDDVKTLVDTQDKLILRHSTVQKTLGIARSERRTSQTKALDLFLEEKQAAEEWMEEQLIRVQHCDIGLGWVLYEFRELPHEFRFRCPRCGQEVVIEGGSMDTLMEVLDEDALKRLKESNGHT